MKRVLAGTERIRGHLGRICIIGNGWNEIAQSVDPPLRHAVDSTVPNLTKRGRSLWAGVTVAACDVGFLVVSPQTLECPTVRL